MNAGLMISELEKGYDDIASGRVQDAGEAFSGLSEMLRIKCEKLNI